MGHRVDMRNGHVGPNVQEVSKDVTDDRTSPTPTAGQWGRLPVMENDHPTLKEDAKPV